VEEFQIEEAVSRLNLTKRQQVLRYLGQVRRKSQQPQLVE
jgi:hypothetical protein